MYVQGLLVNKLAWQFLNRMTGCYIIWCYCKDVFVNTTCDVTHMGISTDGFNTMDAQNVGSNVLPVRELSSVSYCGCDLKVVPKFGMEPCLSSRKPDLSERKFFGIKS
jgi:hypothetical protein